MTVRQLLLLWIIGPITLVYLAVLGYEFLHLREASLAKADERYREALAFRSSSIEAELAAVATAATTAAETLSAVGNVDTASLDVPRRLVTRHAPVVQAAVLKRRDEGATAEIIASTGDTIGRFVTTDAGRPVGEWSSIRAEGEWRSVVFVTRAPLDQERGFVEVGVQVPARSFGHWLEAPIVDRSLLLMLDDEGRYLWHYNPDVMDEDTDIFTFAERVDQPSITEVALAAMRGEPGVQRMPLGFITPEPYLLYHHPVGPQGWTMITAVPENELLEPVYSQLRRTALVMLVGLIFIVAVVVMNARRITGPVERIASAARRIGDSGVYQRGTGSGPRELVLLDRVLADTTVRLKEITDLRVEDVAKRELAEGELRVARRMQEALLPPELHPEIAKHFGVDVRGVNLPARTVAGDFYDYFVSPGGRLVICIADVAGKGAKAAMIMAVARTAFRAASDSSDDPGVMLRSVSRVLNQTTTDTEGSFVTMLALTIDRDGRLLYANAGHPSGVVITRDGMVASCADSTGTLVGIDAPEELQASTASLDLPEDWSSVTLVTDGVLEAPEWNADGDPRAMFGERRLHEAIRKTAQNETANPIDSVVTAVQEFEGIRHGDDVTVLCISRR